MPAAAFTLRSTQIPAFSYMGPSPSSLAVTNPVVHGGDGFYPFYTFEPSDAALAAFGFTRANCPTLFYWQAQGGVSYTGTGTEHGACYDTKAVAEKLGFLTTPDPNWPVRVVFIQIVNEWQVGTSTINGTTNGMRKQKAYLQIGEAVMDAAIAAMGIDRTRMYLTGVSSGAISCTAYLVASQKHPDIFKHRFAAYIGAATWFGTQIRQQVPELSQTLDPNADLPAFVAKVLFDLGIPVWLADSNTDPTVQPSVFASTFQAMRFQYPIHSVQSLTTPTRSVETGGSDQKLTLVTYSGLTALHSATWNTAYGNTFDGPMVATDPMWAWMLKQRYSGRKRNQLQRSGMGTRRMI